MSGRRVPGRRRLLLWLPPLACAAALAAAPLAAAAGSTVGVVSGTAVLLPAPSADETIDAGSPDDDEVQVMLELRDDTDAVRTVHVDRIALVGFGGKRAGAFAGRVGDLVLQPHAGVEGSLRLPAQDPQ